MALLCFETLTKPPSITGEASLCSTHCGNQINLCPNTSRNHVWGDLLVIRDFHLLVVVLSTGTAPVDDGIY